MDIRLITSFLGLCVAMVFVSESRAGENHALTEVYQNNDFQITGISVSKSGRLFVNFPRWSDRYRYAVVEVMPDGSSKPFPDAEWNQWNMKADTAGAHFVCVQSVVVDSTDALWVLDPAAPLMGVVVPGGPKLVRIDLKTNRVTRTIAFGPEVAKPNSYLNDVRFDNGRNTAYLTDSGMGGLVVVDLSSGRSRRVLDGNASTMAQPGVQIVINGKPVLRNAKPMQVNADSIALSPDGEYLYYKPLTGDTLYRIKTSVLRDGTLPQDRVDAAVENVGKVFPTDGFWMDAKGNLYLSDLDHNAVVRRAANGTLERMASDPRLVWPDTFSEGPDGSIYISASHINETPPVNEGKSVRTQAYAVFKFRP